MDKPGWWDWPFACENDHLLERMTTRRFNETDLLEMVESTLAITPGDVVTRYNLYARYDGAY